MPAPSLDSVHRVSQAHAGVLAPGDAGPRALSAVPGAGLGHNCPMNRRSRRLHLALWVFAAALLLKAALPLLASVSARVQGKALVEVCTVYGVARLAPASDMSAPPDNQTAPHGAAHCALSALAALAAPTLPRLATSPGRPPLAARPGADAIPAPDASATWIARRMHGPPGPA